MDNQFKSTFVVVLVTAMITSAVFGGVSGYWAANNKDNLDVFAQVKALFGGSANNKEKDQAGQTEDSGKIIKIEEESAVIKAVEDASPAVVSIIVSKDLPVIERYYSSPFGSDLFERFFGGNADDFFGFGTPSYRQNGTEKREIGGGTGFLVSPDGYIVTNKHVVDDEAAEYTVLMNDETKHEAQVLARDPINDLAIIKIDVRDLPYVELGDSAGLKVGQSVIAIGNSLGEFRNTVSTGVISGLSRSVVAGTFGQSEELLGVIQTDASINFGNSGGPLLNLAGQVIGINTAIAAGAENIGFAIPVNEVKNIYESVKEFGRFVRPWLGVRYVQLNKDIAEANQLEVDYGVLIVRGEERTELAVIPGSPADKAGLVENDIILEINGVKINDENPLSRIVAKQKPGDEIVLKILHKGDEKEIRLLLEEMKQ